MSIELSEALLRKIAGWEVVKRAKSYVADGKVTGATWAPPNLSGEVRTPSNSLPCGLVIKSAVNVDNICRCKDAREWGMMCAHSVAVGLQWLADQEAAKNPPKPAKTSPAPIAAKPEAAPPVRDESRFLTRAASSQTAPSLSVHVIFPPNFEAAISKGRAMLVFEGEVAGKRVPLNAVPRDEPFALDEHDGPLLDAVESLAGESPGMLVFTAAEFGDVLGKLAGHPRLSLGKREAFVVGEEPWPLKVRARFDEESGEIEVRLTGEGLPAVIPAADRLWAIRNAEIRPIQMPACLMASAGNPVRLRRKDIPGFLLRDWPGLVATCDLEANFSLEDFVLEPLTPCVQLKLAGSLVGLEADLACGYDDRKVRPGEDSSDVWLADPKDTRRYATRNVPAEREALERLLRSGFTGPDRKGRYKLNGENQVLNFFARDYPRMEKDWDVSLEERLNRVTESKFERVEPKFSVSSGEQWFDLSMEFSSAGGEQMAAADVQRLLQTGQSYRKLANGKTVLLDTGAVEEFQEVLADCDPRQQGGGYRLSQSQAGYLTGTLSRLGFDSVQAPDTWRRQAGQMRGEVSLEVPPLGQLEGVLRDYQKQGVAWMRFLSESGFCGILADEMGLGKTLQTLAFLTVRKRERTGEHAPALIVCPTSLVHNWRSEIEKFVPDLNAVVLHGAKRFEAMDQLARCDVAITSYALIRRDLEYYQEVLFDTVVLDEAQHIKNRETQNARAVKAVRARHRMVLTGTPMENSVLDLWSIFDFLMPGYLGSAGDFKERYEVPITRDRDKAVQERLSRRLRPFILRRMKRDVAKELPDKIEQVAYCEMTEPQAAIYRQVMEASRKKVFTEVESNGLNKSRMAVLQALLRLRQICCDLRLLDLDDVDPVTSSGKVDMFAELLEEIIDGGHRVLVFSQFVSMLTLLRERLESENVACCYLDGSTKNRHEVVQKFQGDARIPVFLISLKAGGTGLNLTGADTVVHFDPWWNPAIEDQATDRAHRIGQRNVVTSYKLITRGTIEEKILTLQQKKREIIKGMIEGEEQLTESLSWEEIQGLFE